MSERVAVIEGQQLLVVGLHATAQDVNYRLLVQARCKGPIASVSTGSDSWVCRVQMKISVLCANGPASALFI